MEGLDEVVKLFPAEFLLAVAAAIWFVVDWYSKLEKGDWHGAIKQAVVWTLATSACLAAGQDLFDAGSLAGKILTGTVAAAAATVLYRLVGAATSIQHLEGS